MPGVKVRRRVHVVKRVDQFEFPSGGNIFERVRKREGPGPAHPIEQESYIALRRARPHQPEAPVGCRPEHQIGTTQGPKCACYVRGGYVRDVAAHQHRRPVARLDESPRHASTQIAPALRSFPKSLK